GLLREPGTEVYRRDNIAVGAVVEHPARELLGDGDGHAELERPVGEPFTPLRWVPLLLRHPAARRRGEAQHDLLRRLVGATGHPPARGQELVQVELRVWGEADIGHRDVLDTVNLEDPNGAAQVAPADQVP